MSAEQPVSAEHPAVSAVPQRQHVEASPYGELTRCSGCRDWAKAACEPVDKDQGLGGGHPRTPWWLWLYRLVWCGVVWWWLHRSAQWLFVPKLGFCVFVRVVCLRANGTQEGSELYI